MHPTTRQILSIAVVLAARYRDLGLSRLAYRACVALDIPEGDQNNEINEALNDCILLGAKSDDSYEHAMEKLLALRGNELVSFLNGVLAK